MLVDAFDLSWILYVLDDFPHQAEAAASYRNAEEKVWRKVGQARKLDHVQLVLLTKEKVKWRLPLTKLCIIGALY